MTTVETILFTEKAALLEALKDARKRAVAFDRETLREHRAAEKEWEANVKAALKAKVAAVSKLTYADLKEKAGYGGAVEITAKVGSVPQCPTQFTPLIDRQIAIVKASAQEKYTVTPNFDQMWRALTFDFPKERSAC